MIRAGNVSKVEYLWYIEGYDGIRNDINLH